MRTDLTGKRYGRLVVLRFDYSKPCKSGRNDYWLCKCDCGKKKIIAASSLRNNSTLSCGCLNKEIISKPKKHGMSNSKVYWIWHSMIQRCENSNDQNYRLYGARGIKVCDEWHDSSNFIKWALQNGYVSNLTIDRIDSNGNYEPSNCRWVTAKVQANNTSRNHYLTINDETKTIAQWAELNNIPYKLVYKRVRDCGWSFEKAVTQPVRKKMRKNA